MSIDTRSSALIQWVTMLLGIGVVGAGIWARSLLNDAEMAITQEERSHPKPTLIGRLLTVALGIGMIIFGLVGLLHD